MDHQNQSPYYYPQDIPVLYPQEVYLPDPSTSTTTPIHDQPFAYQQQLQQQQQQQQPQLQQLQDPSYPFQRFPRQPPVHQQQYPRPHSHPSHAQSYNNHFHPSLQHNHHHEQLRHAHSQPSLTRVSPPLQYSSNIDHTGSPPHTTRSSPSGSSASYHSDPVSALRDDLQVHAAALAQTAAPLGDHYAASAVPRLPPILQVERQQVTTTATQAASESRRRNVATFRCPVPGCGSTFTRRFNLKGHLRSHTSERPYVCEWPGCGKGFARQHDCKRHYQLHSAKAGAHMCQGCGKSFSRTDALNRHLRSEGGLECRLQQHAGSSSSNRDLLSVSPRGDSGSPSDTTTSGTPSRSRPPSV